MLPDGLPFLQNLGFSVQGDAGRQLKVSANGACVFFYGWNISSYRLWYTLFLIECLDITLFYVSVCKASSLVRHPEGEGEQPVEEGEQPVEEGSGGGAGAGGSQDSWVVTYERKVTETSCSLGSTGDVSHTNLQNLFNTKMGVQLPPPPGQ